MSRIAEQAYVLVFADIEKPNQLPWSTVKALRSHGHASVDLYVLFPLDMALNRLFSFNQEATRANAGALTRFFGHEKWRELADQRITSAQSPELRRRIIELYQEGLRQAGWPYVNVVRDVRRVGRAGLYKMLLATAHPAGDRIANWSAAQPTKKDQGELF